MEKRNKTLSIINLLLLATLLLRVSPSFAQSLSSTSSSTDTVITPSPTPPPAAVSGINLTLSPVFVSLTTKPGTPTTPTQFKVKNNSNAKEFIQITYRKYSVTPEGRPNLADLEATDPFPSWVQLSESSFTLEPNQTKTLTITINPPDTAALGYYYALLIGRQREKDVDGGAAIAGAPALPLLLNVETPNAKKELQLVDFSTDKPFYEYLPVTFTVKTKNTGNIHLIPFGDIFIDQGGRKDIAVLAANEGRGNVIPEQERIYQATWGDGFAVLTEKKDVEGKILKDKDGNTLYTTKLDFAKADRFRIGKYTAHLLMVYDNGERDIPLTATVSFWVVPWKYLILATIILTLAIASIFLIIYIIKLQKRLKKLQNTK